MNRNVESHFSMVPHANISRSQFDRSCSHKTTFNAGDLIPFYVDEVLPGDTFDVKTSKVVRMQTLLTPIMDNVYLDTYYFFVPNRLCWEHWRELNGENTKSAWIPSVTYNVPQITSPPEAGWQTGSLADYFGVPVGVPGLSVNALPFRAYALICNEWFRDQNLTDPLVVPTSDATVVGTNGTNYVQDVAKGGMPFKASKYHDYFTSALPAPQKGPDVTLPVAQAGNLPVVSLADKIDQNLITQRMQFYGAGSEKFPAKLTSLTGDLSIGSSSGATPNDGNLELSTIRNDISNWNLAPSNLWAVSSGNAQVTTINQLRTAFQIQKLYEADSRGGTRYTELLRAHFGVTSPDSRLQRPEYLGGNRIPININQVIQNSAEVTGSTPLGATGAMSLTTDNHSDFRKSFTEHGFVIGVMVARYDHTYQQGLERMWSRKDRFDYFWPVFANLGEQAIKNREIYAQGNAQDDEVFGYQEAWADYRYKPNRVSGEMRSAYAQSLDVWHLADDYSTLPKLSDEWIREDAGTLNRVLAVQDNKADQFFADIYVQNRCTRPMPMYSVPGLIDHH